MSANLETALAEIKRAEEILRSRYHYEHPIFGHLATAREAVEAALAPAAPPTPEPEAEEVPPSASEVEIEQGLAPPPVSAAEPESTEGQPPARRAGRK